MKKMMYIALGLLFVSPVMAQEQRTTNQGRTTVSSAGMTSMSQEVDTAAFHKAMAKFHESMNQSVLSISFLHFEVSKSNRMLANAWKLVAKELEENKEVSFEAMDLLGMSLNTIHDPLNIKTTGKHHEKIEQAYVKKVLAMLDMSFASKGKTLSEIAEQVQSSNPDETLTNYEIFKKLNGSVAKKFLEAEKAGK